MILFLPAFQICIDFKRSTIVVVRSLEETRNGLSLKEPKTAKARRTIVLSPSVLDTLEQHKSKQTGQKALLGDAYEDNDLGCAQEDGRSLGQCVSLRDSAVC